MRNKKKTNQLLIIMLVTGFLLGLILAIRLGLEASVFEENSLSYLKTVQMNHVEYLRYIVLERAGTLLLLVFLSQIRWKYMYSFVVVGVSGFVMGMCFWTMFHQVGLRGIGIFGAALFPHTIFYVISYWLLIKYWLKKSSVGWNKIKTIGLLVFMTLGILAEVYISPFLVKMIL